MNGITYDQIRGPIERVVLFGLGLLVGKGVITPADVTNYAAIIMTIIAAFYGWWQNRPKAILQSAAAIPGTTVVTDPSISNDTPEKNIVSNLTNSVKPR